MNGDFVGVWSVQPQIGETLQYDEAWVASGRGRPLSLSLPFTPGNPPHRGQTVRSYFENLLPDSQNIRERVARRFQAGSTDAFSLLAEVGRDCAGAVQVMPRDVAPDPVTQVDAIALSDAQVAQALRSTLTPGPLGGRNADDDDRFRISIAGAQEKTAMLWLDGLWCRPHGATPTTHIFKMPLGLVGNLKFDMSHSVENEWLCSEILHAYGLPVARTQPLMFEDMKVLAVERFDRSWWRSDDGKRWLIRLPQEDICQATGTPPHLKHESDGGPGVRGIMKLLATQRTSAFFCGPAARTNSPRCTTFCLPILSSVPARISFRRSRPAWRWPCAPRTPIGSCTTFCGGIGSPSVRNMASWRLTAGARRRWSTTWLRERRKSCARCETCCRPRFPSTWPIPSSRACRPRPTDWRDSQGVHAARR